MRTDGTAVRVHGDDLDTDVMYPGAFLNIEDPAEMASHLFEGFDPSLRERLEGDTILVVDRNFGIGSSREHVLVAMKASGVRGIVGKSFARIFFRNAVNLGLPLFASVTVPAAVADGERVELDLAAGRLVAGGRELALPPLAPFVVAILEAGGIAAYVRRHGRFPEGRDE